MSQQLFLGTDLTPLLMCYERQQDTWSQLCYHFNQTIELEFSYISNKAKATVFTPNIAMVRDRHDN
jgi:hypothetical protein